MDRDQELALLGLLENQLGDRQRALAGLHLEEGASRSLHAEMVALQREATERDKAQLETAERRAEPRGTPRHRRPSRVLHAVVRLTDRH